MRLVLFTSFTMIAFASNSILTRMAIEPGYIDPLSFALIRVLSGALLMCCVLWVRGTPIPFGGRRRLVGAGSLAVYMIGFSLAYVSLDAGFGALILFGVVQVTMFTYSTLVGVHPTGRQIFGAAIAFAGLIVALWPDTSATGEIWAAVCMVAAGIGWAAYTLSGKNAQNPLSETGANFAVCFPVLMVVSLPFVDHASFQGIALAILCGAVTSGLGYALWYKVLPYLERSVAAVVQLSVPIIAIIAGALFLGEVVTTATLVAAALVVIGIAMAVTQRSVPKDRK